MITEQEAQELMKELISLREKAKKTKDPQIIKNFRAHERKCIDNFKYVIKMKTSRYKSFSNYDDLNQEAHEALLKAMSNYNPKKGSFFWWCHKYIDTRISRTANLHTTIRYPLRVAKETTPHKEQIPKNLIDIRLNPERSFEYMETKFFIHEALEKLPQNQRQIMTMLYGVAGDKPASINKVCETLNISRASCIKEIKSASIKLKEIVSFKPSKAEISID